MREQLNQIHERNRRVEADKAWETSKTRRSIIAVMTYAVVVVFLWLIGVSNPFLNALVPVVGFLLSTLTLSYFKKKWVARSYKK
ncbi:hypothetical protein HYV86_02085 [Candidatus Woesearchaeota archaeon]|nr:hypothetical protein [Candidatus Woesearchaeota archaeon]